MHVARTVLEPIILCKKLFYIGVNWIYFKNIKIIQQCNYKFGFILLTNAKTVCN